MMLRLWRSPRMTCILVCSNMSRELTGCLGDESAYTCLGRYTYIDQQASQGQPHVYAHHPRGTLEQATMQRYLVPLWPTPTPSDDPPEGYVQSFREVTCRVFQHPTHTYMCVCVCVCESAPSRARVEWAKAGLRSWGPINTYVRTCRFSVSTRPRGVVTWSDTTLLFCVYHATGCWGVSPTGNILIVFLLLHGRVARAQNTRGSGWQCGSG